MAFDKQIEELIKRGWNNLTPEEKELLQRTPGTTAYKNAKQQESDRVNLIMPKDTKEKIQNYIKDNSIVTKSGKQETVNGFINRLIAATLSGNIAADQFPVISAADPNQESAS